MMENLKGFQKYEENKNISFTGLRQWTLYYCTIYGTENTLLKVSLTIDFMLS